MTENKLKAVIASATQQLERLKISSVKAAETLAKTAQALQSHIDSIFKKEELELPKEVLLAATEEEYIAVYDPQRSDWG